MSYVKESEFDKLRSEILEVTKEILRLVARRQSLCVKIGELKQAKGLGVEDLTVERILREAIAREALSLGIDKDFAQRLTTLLIEECIKVQPKPPERKVLTHRDIARMAETLERQGVKVIRMDVGEPDFRTPNVVVERAYQEMKAGRSRYTEPKGRQELRQAIADYVKTRFGAEIKADQVIATVGGAFGVYLALASTVAPGDEVIVIDPSWPIYKSCVRYVGGRPIVLETRLEDDWEPDLNELNEKVSSATKAIVLNYPCNPTGKSLGKKTFKGIVEIAQDKKLTLISDEVYADYNFTGSEHNTVLRYTDVSYVMISSFSKSWGMTGFRVGFVISDLDRINKMTAIQSMLITCIPEFIQYAAIEALKCLDEARRNSEVMKDRADAVCKALESLPVSFYKPDGAMYVFPRIDVNGIDGSEFAVKLLEKKNVSVAPGGAFGNYFNYFRMSLGQPKEVLLEGVRRIGEFLSSISS
ncbi:MAG: aminotransferase class I/II-fold pyridoxal phosphate-dependent enzyme [Aigarchaeota archaeon]|nr:aminotransferase class I/II-fold pyridoxal phosphate-dependent enzyme [Aigarchaeota archaeon]